MAEKLITRGKTDSVHNRRVAARYIYDETVVNKLFKEIGPLFAERNGGYTRILKTGNRLGDAAEMMQLRWSYSSLSRRQRRKRKLQRRLTRKPTRPKQSKAMLQ